MGTKVDDVLIVGGGDSGLLTALALRQVNPRMDVSVVDDFDQDLPRVGKGTFLEIHSLLHGNLDIDEQRFISEVKPVWKATVYFEDWCDSRPFHYPFDPGTKFPEADSPNAIQRYYHWYTDRYADPNHRSIGEELVEQGKSPWQYDPSQGAYDRYERIAYHLDIRRFNSFLRDLCRERDVSLVDDRIVDVDTYENRIERVRSADTTYGADLYVDASGFSRVVSGELDSAFREFDFPLDAAFTTRVDRSLADVVPATVVETGDYGWFWQIDTYDERDLGYVFASEFVSDDDARAEFVEHCGGSVTADDVEKYEFDSGYYDPACVENCIAIGNAGGFIEPLQATALTTHLKTAVKFSLLLSAHGRILDDSVRDGINAWVRNTWESIYDFISIHYAFSSGDSEFWRAMQSIELSDRAELLISEFDRTGLDRNVDPTARDPDVSPLEVFHPMSFYLIMRNMGATSSFYEDNEFHVSEEFKQQAAEIDRATTKHVEQYITTEEMYTGVVDAW